MSPLTSREKEAIEILEERIAVPRDLPQRWRNGLPEEWFRKFGDALFSLQGIFVGLPQRRALNPTETSPE